MGLERALCTQTFGGHTAVISSLAFASDGKTLVSGSWDSTIKLWSLRVFQEVATLRAHSGQVTHVEFSPDGHTLASASATDFPATMLMVSP